MNRVRATTENIDRVAALLRNGAVVAFPTETVYGLGAHAFDASAVARIFEIKARPSFDPLIVHVADESVLRRVVTDVPPAAQALIAKFWPGPLTLVLRKHESVPGIVTSGLSSVGVRMPAHPVAHELLTRAGVPIAAPSANPFGYLSPTRAEHVEDALGDRVDWILDDGATQFGIESTIVSFDPQPTLLRYGALAVEEIEEVIGPLARAPSHQVRPLAPGLLDQHYAPRTPIFLIDGEVPMAKRRGAALLAFQEPLEGYDAVRVLSREGDLREAAAHLFDELHELDALGLERIDAQIVPEQGIGVAILDRLRRASYR